MLPACIRLTPFAKVVQEKWKIFISTTKIQWAVGSPNIRIPPHLALSTLLYLQEKLLLQCLFFLAYLTGLFEYIFTYHYQGQ